MLTQFRGAIKGVVAWLIIALMVLAFAFVGLPNIANFTQSSALKVGDMSYSGTDVQSEFNRQLTIYRQRTGESLTTSEAVQAGLLNQTLDDIAMRASLAQDADSLGLVATNEMVGDYLRAEPAFENPNTGEFDTSVLASILQNNNLSLQEFRDRIQEELIRGQIIESLNTPLAAPEPWIDFLLKRQGESREVTYVVIEADPATVEQPTADDLQAYYDDNLARYTAPEYRTFEAVILRNADFTEGLEVSEEELRQLFEVRREQLTTPETRTVRQLTYDNEEAAASALSRLQSGTPFEQLAEEQDLSVERVTYENVARASMTDPAVADALFEPQEAGATVGPVNGLFGYTIGEVLDITPGEETTFEEQRETLEAELLEDETSRRLFDAVEAIEMARDTGASLAEAVSEVDQATLQTVGPVSVTGETPDGTMIEGLPQGVISEAFALSEGDETPVLDLPDADGYFAIYLDTVRDPAPRPFEAVEAEVRDDYVSDRQSAAVQERLAQLREAVAGETPLGEAAAAIDASATTRNISLAQPPEVLPRPFLQDIFSAGLGDLITGESPDGTTAYAGIVRSASFAGNAQRDQIMELYRQSAGQQIASELTQVYLTALQDDLEIRRDEEQISRLFNLDTE